MGMTQDQERYGIGCPICELPSAEVESTAHGFGVRCLRCGAIEITEEARINFRRDRAFDGWRVSAWVRQVKPKLLTWAFVEGALRSKPPSLMQRARFLLVALAKNHSIGSPIKWTEDLVAIGWCVDKKESEFLLDAVLGVELGWLRVEKIPLPSSGLAVFGGGRYLTAKGLLELEKTTGADSPVGFCAMWFDDSMLPFYVDVIEKAIGASGYEPVRLDHKEHNNNIHDEIIASIRGAKFVIAEMTGHRGGVYFEAGFAHGLGLPVIYMVQEDDKDNVHFDVQSQNFILWSPADLPDARKRLENRIRATLGQGPLNPDRR
jgi:hypothetical protein